MLKVQSFCFNPFQENSYILHDTLSGEAIIFDPGCNDIRERSIIHSYINDKKINLTKLINTHCHIDHVLGNRFISEQYDLNLSASPLEIPVLSSCLAVSKMYSIFYDPSPEIMEELNEGDIVRVGNHTLQILFCPGHSPGSLCFYSSEFSFLIGGDVLFYQSIGRSDLPGGNHHLLLESIRTKLFALPKETCVYPGHGPSTTIAHEMANNPFF